MSSSFTTGTKLKSREDQLFCFRHPSKYSVLNYTPPLFGWSLSDWNELRQFLQNSFTSPSILCPFMILIRSFSNSFSIHRFPICIYGFFRSILPDPSLSCSRLSTSVHILHYYLNRLEITDCCY